MSGGARASPARCENSTKAPSTDAWTAGGTTSRMTAASGPLYHVDRRYVARMRGPNHRRSSTSNRAAHTGAPSTNPARAAPPAGERPEAELRPDPRHGESVDPLHAGSRPRDQPIDGKRDHRAAQEYPDQCRGPQHEHRRVLEVVERSGGQ